MTRRYSVHRHLPRKRPIRPDKRERPPLFSQRRHRVFRKRKQTFSRLNDVLPHKLNEKVLSLSELLDDETIIVVGLDVEGNIQYFNRAIESITGFTREEVLGRNWFETLCPKEQFPDVFQGFQKLKNKMLTSLYENPILTKQGTLRHVLWSNKMLRWGRRIYGTLSFGFDITEKMKLEDDLIQTRAHVQALLEHTDDCILICDETGSPVLFNKAYRNIMKNALNLEMKPGIKPHTLLSDPEERARWDSYHRRVLSGEKFRIEYCLTLGTDTPRYFEFSYNPVIEKGQVIGFTEISRDITRRKESEIAVQHSLKEKEVLLRELHHRVKNNMSLISSLLNLQAHHLQDPKFNKVIKECNSRIHSLSLIHEHLLSQKSISQISLKAYIEKLVKFLHKSMLLRPVKIEISCEPPNLVLGIDRMVPFGLILNELITNVFKHAFSDIATNHPPQLQIALHTSTSKQSSDITVNIADNGGGFAAGVPPDLSTIAGFGLNIVSNLVEQLDGTISITTGLHNRGCGIHLSFPQ